jgi:hypothetical protein
MKKYRVLFFTTSVGPTGAPLSDSLPLPLLQTQTILTKPTNLQPQIIDGHEFQVRDFHQVRGSHVWKGVFGRLRDDAPHVVDARDLESPIPLQPTDRLIEKCHFLYIANHDILVWQVNKNVASVSKFSFFIGNLLNSAVFVNIVVGANSLQRVIGGTVKNIECKVAAPRTPLTATPNYSQPMFDLMNSVHGATIKVNISAGRGTLSGSIRRLISWANANPDTKTLKAKLEGEDEPIDLLVDRISVSIEVPLTGHYPNPVHVFNKLDAAFNLKRQELAPFFR